MKNPLVLTLEFYDRRGVKRNTPIGPVGNP